jgi:hypothetical protein
MIDDSIYVIHTYANMDGSTSEHERSTRFSNILSAWTFVVGANPNNVKSNVVSDMRGQPLNGYTSMMLASNQHSFNS